ncbi:MAG: hypothetical protein J5367_04180, partial [Lachnospiraceae bacterium]|nr:hypothetical protein [Lachnospiraceae bacterium]
MKQNDNEKFIVYVLTLASFGLIVENVIMEWEYWVPLAQLIGVASLWVVSLSDKIDYSLRKAFYFVIAALMVLYQGIHKTSYFDIALTVSLAMATFSILNSIHMMNIILLEYAILLFIHFINLPGGEPITFDRITISRTLLHIVIVLLVYLTSVRLINNRLDDEETNRIKDEKIESNDANMEDFLSNISHELRTPVNVVNGMSDLLIKKATGHEADVIKSAGVRLAYQIEDIQDYTECKRGKVFLEEDDYMSTSLIDDVVTAFRMNDNSKDLELVVDLKPQVPAM